MDFVTVLSNLDTLQIAFASEGRTNDSLLMHDAYKLVLAEWNRQRAAVNLPEHRPFQNVPSHCNRVMWSVINRHTAKNAISREHDTLVWTCVECGYHTPRPTNIEVSADGSQFRLLEASK